MPLKDPALPLAATQGPCHESSWKYTFVTGGALGANALLAVKLNAGVEVAVVLPERGAMAVVIGIACTGCSVITVTLLLVWLPTYTVLVTGLTARGLGSVPTVSVAAVLLAPSITLTVPAVLLLT